MDNLRPPKNDDLLALYMDLLVTATTFTAWRDHASRLIHHFVDGRLFVTRSGYDVLVVSGNVAAQHRRGFFGLKRKRNDMEILKNVD